MNALTFGVTVAEVIDFLCEDLAQISDGLPYSKISIVSGMKCFMIKDKVTRTP